MPIPEDGVPEKILWVVGWVVGFIQGAWGAIKSKV